MIVVVVGLPGSGKSYFASRLSALLDAVYISSDRVRKEMFPVRVYSDAEKGQVYQAMFKEAGGAVQRGRNVVVDATFWKKDMRAIFLDGANSATKPIFIWIAAEEKLIKERLRRKRKDSDADLAVYERIRQQWDPLEEPHLTLPSTDGNIDEMLSVATDYLNKQCNDKSRN